MLLHLAVGIAIGIGIGIGIGIAIAIAIGIGIGIGFGFVAERGRVVRGARELTSPLEKSRRRQEVEGESNPTHLCGNPGLYSSPYINQENPASSHIAAR